MPDPRTWLGTVRGWLGSAARDRPSRSGPLVFDGDSIACGSGAPPGMTLADQVARDLGFRGPLRVVAAPGSPVSERERLFPTLVAPLFDAGARDNVIVFHAGDNDIAMGAEADETYRCLTHYVGRARRQGWIVVLSTELPRFDFTPVQQRELLRFNAMMLDNAAGADGVIDFAADPIMGGIENRADPRYYIADGIHPTGGGYAILAAATSRELRRHLRDGASPGSA